MAQHDRFSDNLPSLQRRRFLVAGAAALTTGVAGAWLLRGRSSAGGGTGTGVNASVANVAPRPRRGGHLQVAFDGAAMSTFLLDPHNSGFAPHNRIIRSVFDSLTRLRPDYTVGPWLAESWTISPDACSYVFKLREGIKFHDGTVFDANALKFNFDRLADPKNTLTSRTSIGPYLRSEVLAADRLQVTLSEPFTPFLRNLSMTKLGIISPTALTKYGPSIAQNPVGTGPFRFVSSKPATEVKLERNLDYQSGVRSGAAHLDALTFLNVPEESTRVAVLLSGQVQATDLIPPQNLPALKADRNFQVLEKELLNTNYALLLNASRAPWDDDEMRLAVRLSLDIDTIVRVIYMGGLPRAWSVLSPSLFGSAERELTKSWQPDSTRAKEILAAKGWLPGADGIRQRANKRLEIRFIDTQGNREKRLDVLQLVRRQLAASGISLTVETIPTGMYTSRISSNEFDLTGGASFHADPDILRQSYVPALRTVLAGNKVEDPEIIAWLNAGAREPEGPSRADYYHKVQRKILDKTYAIPIYVLRYNLALSKQVQGVELDAHGFPEFHNAWLAA